MSARPRDRAGRCLAQQEFSSLVNAPPTMDSRQRWTILGAIMLGLFLSAMDQTIVGTAMPRIIAELSGLKLYAWVFTSYMLASTTLVPIVGKMGDIYGRKGLFLAGIAVFLVGSMLCGMSQSMVQLIIFRGVQGVGGGMIFANAFAIIGDLYTPAERGKYAGIMSGVFGLASIIGPLIGGAITDHLHWRWVFYVNLPLGALALAVLAAVLPASARHDDDRRPDYIGAVLLATSIAPLLLAFSWAGTDYAWLSVQVIAPLALAAAAGAVFVSAELRADEPIVPLSLFRNRIFAVCTAVTFVSGGAMFAGSVYIPLFMQGVLNFSATNAGLVLTPMTLAMVAGSTTSGQLVSRFGRYKYLLVGGLGVSASGLFLLSRLTAGSSQVAGMRDMALVGLGLGLGFPVLMLATQNAVPYRLMGVTTSLNQFARSVGGTIGVAIMGSILTRRLHDQIAAGLPERVQREAPAPLLAGLSNPRILLDDNALARMRDQGFNTVFGADGPALFSQSIASIRTGLASAITDVFLIAAVLMAVAVVIAIALREAPLRRTFDIVPQGEGAALTPDEADAEEAATVPRAAGAGSSGQS
jgi:EmrB/QacA subfamily drug resistance transporter